MSRRNKVKCRRFAWKKFSHRDIGDKKVKEIFMCGFNMGYKDGKRMVRSEKLKENIKNETKIIEN